MLLERSLHWSESKKGNFQAICKLCSKTIKHSHHLANCWVSLPSANHSTSLALFHILHMIMYPDYHVTHMRSDLKLLKMAFCPCMKL